LALWVPLVFTAPADDQPYWPPYSGVVRYEAQRAQGEAEWAAATLYSAPAPESTRVQPLAPGSAEQLYVSQSSSVSHRIAGGSQYRVRAVDASGNASAWSNYVVVQVACQDTLWALVRLIRDPQLRPIITSPTDGPMPWRYASGLVSWALPPGDTTRTAIWTCSQVQRWYRVGTCAIYHYWVDRGTYQACSDTIGVLTPPAHAPGSPVP
ncbi:MAG: hypothetical protein Q8R97_05250, partial [Brevundimonas sp.]|nr:hypothetical protein [Brevundimonas sp.]